VFEKHESRSQNSRTKKEEEAKKRAKKKKEKRRSLDQVLFETEKRVNIEEPKQNVITARWSVIVQASAIPGVGAASYARNYLKKYYNDLVDEEPTAPDANGKKKGG
jgi:hypothetical protein